MERIKYSAWNLTQIKEECERLGLPPVGKKSDLIKAIKDHVDKANREQAFANQELFDSSFSKVSGSSIKLKDNEYIVQLNVANIGMYFAHGLIYPNSIETSDVFRLENRKEDILTRYPDYLVLSKYVLAPFDESQVLITVVLSPEELARLASPQKKFILYQFPIPISRVGRLYFFNATRLKSFIASLSSFSDYFIPAELCSTIPNGLEARPLENDIARPVVQQASMKQLAAKFDKLLGLFAFLKNATQFYANSTNEFHEYSKSYFDALALLNTATPSSNKANQVFRWIIFPENIDVDGTLARYQFKKIIGAIYEDVVFDVDWALSLLNEGLDSGRRNEGSAIQNIQKLFAEYGSSRIDYRSMLASPLVKAIPLQLLVLLVKFANKSNSHTDKQAVRNYFASTDKSIDNITAEYILAVLGLYYGYHTMVRGDSIRFVDPFFNELGRDYSNIKFRLDSFLDRFTIETVFQFCLMKCKQINDGFDFLKDQTRKEQLPPDPPKSRDNEYIDMSVDVLGKYVSVFRRVSILERHVEEIKSFYGSSIGQSQALFSFVAKHYPQLLDIKTDAILEALRADPKAVDVLKDYIELDRKSKQRK